MFRRTLSPTVSRMLLAVMVAAGLTNVSRADQLNGQPIYALNRTANPVFVAARYFPPGGGGYVNNGFWRIAPGQKLLMFYNGNRVTIYLHVHDDQGREIVLGSSGTPVRATIRGRTVNLYPENTGKDWRPRVFEIRRSR